MKTKDGFLVVFGVLFVLCVLLWRTNTTPVVEAKVSSALDGCPVTMGGPSRGPRKLGNRMASITKSYTFDTTAQGEVDTGSAADIAFGWYGSDGTPSSGCVRFATNTSAMLNESSIARGSASDTWETLGVPVGATVTAVQLVQYFYKAVGTGMVPGNIASLSIRAVSNTTNVSSAGDLVPAFSVPSTGWHFSISAPSRAVDSAYQASNTPVRLELECDIVKGIPTNVAALLDNMVLQVTYTAPAANNYTDTPQTKVGVKTSVSDVFYQALVMPPNFMGFRTSAVDLLSTAETPQTKVGIKTSVDDGANTEYTRMGLHTSVLDVLTTADAPQSKVGIRSFASALDYIPKNIVEYVQTRFGLRPIMYQQSAQAVDAPQTKIGLHTSQADAFASVDAPKTKIGEKTSAVSSQGFTDAVQTRLGIKTSAQDAGSFRYSVQTKFGLKSSSVDVPAFVETVRTKIGRRNSEVDLVASVNAVQTRIGEKSSALSQQAIADAVQTRIGLRTSQTGVQAAKDAPQTKVGGANSQTNLRITTDLVQTKIGIRNASAPLLAALDTPKTKIGFRTSQTTENQFHDQDLIIACRAVAKATLTNVTQFPESESDITTGDGAELLLPFLILAAQEPQRDDSYAVEDEAQWIPVDFVLAVKRVGDGATDTPYVVRRQLNAVVNAVLKASFDYSTLLGQIVTNAYQEKTPIDRANQYQQTYTSGAQPVVVMAMTINFSVVSSLVE